MVFNILALGGGGSKGILHVGALKVLEERYGDLTKKFTGGVYGCSVGSIIATAVAFGLDVSALTRMSCKFTSFEIVTTRNITLTSLQNSLTKKGLFDMDGLEKLVVEIFEEEGIILHGKVISESKIPLFITSSNITKQVPTVFKGNVPILKAIRASCCIPVLFCPQIINNNVYVDGGYLTNIILDCVPKDQIENTLSISINHDDPKLTPSNLVDMSYIEFMYGLYKTTCIYERRKNKYENNIDLFYNLESGISDVGKEHRENMIETGEKLTRAFFAKRLHEE